MFQRCLICTDFSDSLHRLVHFVSHLAKGGFKHIVFLHSISIWEEGRVTGVDEAKISQAKERLSAALQSIPEGVEVKVEVLSGTPVESILRVVNKDNIDVILMGASIRNALESKFFGSTSAEVARKTDIPIMILRPQLISTYRTEELALRCQHLYRYLLIPYNDSETSHYLIRRIKDYATHRPVNSFQECLLLWVVQESKLQADLLQYRLQEAQEKLAEVKADLEKLGLIVNSEVRQGELIAEVLDAATNHNISAIAIADYSNNLLDFFVANVADEMLHRFWFPLLLFSPQK